MYDSDVGSEKFTPLEELKRIDQQVDQVETLSGLQPLFARLEEITKEHSGDFEVQLVAHDVKQHILARGSAIKQMPPAPAPVPVPVAPVESRPLAAEPPPPVMPVPALPRKNRKKKFALVFVLLVALGALAIGYSVWMDRSAKIAATTLVDVNIATVPAGAAIQVNGQQTCTSDCVAKLLPGTYEVTATLDGFDSASSKLTVEAAKAGVLKLTMKPQAPRVRIVAEMAAGQVFLDDQPVGELQDGQFVIENLQPGPHTVKVSGGTSETTIPVEVALATMPVIPGPVLTKNLLAVLVPHSGAKARLQTSTTPMKLTLNGQVQADLMPEGIDVPEYKAGAPFEFVLGEGKLQKTVQDTFSAATELAVFLKTDQNLGTLWITTGEDDVRVFVNERENKRRTEKGQVRIQAFGKVTVRVQKTGFDDPAPQTATVAKGAEVKLAFTLKESPKFGTLMITGGTPGAEVLLDQRSIGSLGADGSYQNLNIAPGDHTIELRRDQFEARRFPRGFRAGQTVTIAGAEAVLTAVKVAAPPPSPPPPPPPPATVKQAPKARTGDMSNFEAPGTWRMEDNIWKHRGAATLTYGIQPNGIFTFSIYMLKGGSLLRGGRVRWVLGYQDPKNYLLFELDEENLWSKVVENGKTLERKKIAHKQDKSMRVWNILIDSSSGRLVHKIQGDNGWTELDSWSEPGRDFTQGKFGILVTGNDEVGLSNFQFTGR